MFSAALLGLDERFELVPGRGRLGSPGEPSGDRSLQILFPVFHRVCDIALCTDHVDLPFIEMGRSGSLLFAQDAAVHPRLFDLLACLDSRYLQVRRNSIGMIVQPLLEIFDFLVDSIDHHSIFSYLLVTGSSYRVLLDCSPKGNQALLLSRATLRQVRPKGDGFGSRSDFKLGDTRSFLLRGGVTRERLLYR